MQSAATGPQPSAGPSRPSQCVPSSESSYLLSHRPIDGGQARRKVVGRRCRYIGDFGKLHGPVGLCRTPPLRGSVPDDGLVCLKSYRHLLRPLLHGVAGLPPVLPRGQLLKSSNRHSGGMSTEQWSAVRCCAHQTVTHPGLPGHSFITVWNLSAERRCPRAQHGQREQIYMVYRMQMFSLTTSVFTYVLTVLVWDVAPGGHVCSTTSQLARQALLTMAKG